MIQIDKNVKKPSIKPSEVGNRKYPFNQMDIGDSFAVPREKNNSVFAALKQYLRRSETGGKKFEKYLLEEKGKKVVRIFRVK